MQISEWNKYFCQTQCDCALTKHNVEIDYGEEVYVSTTINNVRWLVTQYKNEYEVFAETLFPGTKPQRNWCACFHGRDRALAFALKMVLVCNGKIHRKDWQGIT